MNADFIAPVFTRQDDGSVTVDQFPDRILIAREFLASAESDHLTRRGRLVTIIVSNDRASYRLIRRQRWHTFEAHKVSQC